MISQQQPQHHFQSSNNQQQCQQQQQYHQQQQQHAESNNHAIPIFNGVDPTYPGLFLIHHDPPIYGVRDFLTPEECHHLINVASDAFAPASVVGSGAGVVSESQRTSSSCYLAREDLPNLCRKVSKLTSKPISHMELPQVCRYTTSQRYLPHYDAFDLDEPDGQRFAANGGQRTVTVLVYLNDVQDGGGQTAFPHLVAPHQQPPQQLEVRPVQGTALVFFPATVDGHLDPRALHAALPAIDTKYVSQVWIRQGN